MGEELTKKNDTEVRWRGFFLQLLNGGKICKVGWYFRRAGIRGNGRVVRKEVNEIIGALKKMKGGKVPDIDVLLYKC